MHTAFRFGFRSSVFRGPGPALHMRRVLACLFCGAAMPCSNTASLTYACNCSLILQGKGIPAIEEELETYHPCLRSQHAREMRCCCRLIAAGVFLLLSCQALVYGCSDWALHRYVSAPTPFVQCRYSSCWRCPLDVNFSPGACDSKQGNQILTWQITHAASTTRTKAHSRRTRYLIAPSTSECCSSTSSFSIDG